MSPKRIVEGGQFYRRAWNGALEPAAAGEPDVWICRRLVDYPNAVAPAGGELAQCTRCCALIVFNPAREVGAPKMCMQCSGITPLPIKPTKESQTT